MVVKNGVTVIVSKYILTLFLAVLVCSPPARADGFTLQVIIYPPLAFMDEDRIRGVVPEVVRELQKRVGNSDVMEATPWLRGYEQTQKLPRHAIFPIVRIPKREKLFKWVGPIFMEGDYFFKRKGSPLRINTVEDAKAVRRIAVRKDGYTHQTLEHAGFTNLDVGPSYESSYRKLEQGRVDLVLMGERTYYHMVKNAGLHPEQFERTDCRFAESGAWIAFSRDVDDAVIARWQHALDELKQEGVFLEIMERNFRQ